MPSLAGWKVSPGPSLGMWGPMSSQSCSVMVNEHSWRPSSHFPIMGVASAMSVLSLSTPLLRWHLEQEPKDSVARMRRWREMWEPGVSTGQCGQVLHWMEGIV